MPTTRLEKRQKNGKNKKDNWTRLEKQVDNPNLRIRHRNLEWLNVRSKELKVTYDKIRKH